MEEEGEEEGSSSDLLHPLSSFRAIGRRIEATTTTRIHVHWASFRSLEASSFFSLPLSGLALAGASAASLIWLSSRSNRADRRTKRRDDPLSGWRREREIYIKD